MMYRSCKYILPVLVAAFCFCSCKKAVLYFAEKGETVRFSVGSGCADTKASYSGVVNNNLERIDWQTGDIIRILCNEVSEPASKYADYRISEVFAPESGSSVSKARIEGIGGIGLRWGDGDHTFYAAYPSPAMNGITKSLSGHTVSASLPSEQKIIGDIAYTDGNYVAEPDLKNMLMTARATYNPSSGLPDESVFLSFTALSTAIKFVIKNGTGSELDLVSLQLISGNGKTTAQPVISGSFSVDMDNISRPAPVKPFSDSDFTVSYNMDYPACSGSATSTDQDGERTLTINVGTESSPLVLADGKTLTFTFFLVPTHDFGDLTFKLVKAGGNWMSTRLGYTDGSGVFFPRFKKSTAEGILVPEGAKWYINFGAELVPWDTDPDSNMSLVYPEGEVLPFMTQWDELPYEDIEMK